MKKNNGRKVFITLNSKNEIIRFRCDVNGFPYIATDIKGKVIMTNWDSGSAMDQLEALKAIGNVAARYGYSRMQTYVEHSAPSFELVENYINERNGISTWNDKRYWQYEWDISF